MIDFLLLALLLWGMWSWRNRRQAPPTRDAALMEIIGLMRTHGITTSDLAQAETLPLPPPSPKRNVAATVLSCLGGIFLLGGLMAYITMFWPGMSSFMRIFVTLGVGVALSIFSGVAMKENKYPRIILPLILLAAAIETVGWGVFIDELFPHTGDLRKAVCFIFAVMALQEAATFGLFRRTSLLFLSLFFAYGFIANALDLAGMHVEWIAMLLGGSLLCVSHWTSRTRYKALSEPGYGIGAIWFNAGIFVYLGDLAGWNEAAMATGISLCCLAYGLKRDGYDRLAASGFFIGSAIFYGGLFDAVHHTHYELAFLFAAIVLMYAHTLLKSGALLATSTLAILGFIGYYTSEYFVHSIGWPVALMLLGIAFLAVSAWALRIKRR